ncbi:MAG: hypothetical protein AAF125_21925, partial [Chloroflexota bacterium]
TGWFYIGMKLGWLRAKKYLLFMAQHPNFDLCEAGLWGLHEMYENDGFPPDVQNIVHAMIYHFNDVAISMLLKLGDEAVQEEIRAIANDDGVNGAWPGWFPDQVREVIDVHDRQNEI